MITRDDLVALIESATSNGYKVKLEELQLTEWKAGTATHVPEPLPKDCCSIFVYQWNDMYLKVCRALPKANDIYQLHHYKKDTSRSNLAKSLMSDPYFKDILGKTHPGDWVKANTTRYNVLIPASAGELFLHFAYIFFVWKCSPRF